MRKRDDGVEFRLVCFGSSEQQTPVSAVEFLDEPELCHEKPVFALTGALKRELSDKFCYISVPELTLTGS